MTTRSEPSLLQDLRDMDNYLFEKLVADIWEALGYRVHVRDASGDKGVDVEATHHETGENVVIQAKCYSKSNKVGRPSVQQYHSLYQQENADNVIIVSTGYFTNTAKESAQELDVELVNGTDLCGILSDLEDGDQITQHYFGRGTPSQRRWGNNYFGRSTLLQAVVALLGGVYILGAYGSLSVTPLSPPIPSFLTGLFKTFTVGGVPGSGLSMLAALAIAVVLLKWAYLWRWKVAGLMIPISGFAALLVSAMNNPQVWLQSIVTLLVLLCPIVVPAMFSFNVHWRALNLLQQIVAWGHQNLQRTTG